MQKQLYNSYRDWKEDYGLTSEREYQSTQDYDFMRCFEAGYNLSQKQKKESAVKIDCSTSLLQKLQQILFTHYGMRDMRVDMYGKATQKVTLVFELNPERINLYYHTFQDGEYDSFRVLCHYPGMTKVEMICYTSDLNKTLLDIIVKLT